MNARVFLLASALTAPALADPRGLHSPSDVRMPVHFGLGFSGLFDGSTSSPARAAAFSFGIEGAFIGKEIFPHVRPQLVLGVDGGRAAEDLPTVLPDKTGALRSRGFPRAFAHVVTGVGALFGSERGFAVSIFAAPGAVVSSVPGSRDEESIGTVGFGVLGRVEVIPLYLSLRKGARASTEDDEDRDVEPVSAWRWILASVSFHLTVRGDWVETPSQASGATLAGGLSVDFARVFVIPLVRALGR